MSEKCFFLEILKADDGLETAVFPKAERKLGLQTWRARLGNLKPDKRELAVFISGKDLHTSADIRQKVFFNLNGSQQSLLEDALLDPYNEYLWDKNNLEETAFN